MSHVEWLQGNQDVLLLGDCLCNVLECFVSGIVGNSSLYAFYLSKK